MSNLRDRHAKILATIGPASSSPEMLEKLFNAGADAFRLNFSHGDYEIHKNNIKNIRALEEKVGRPITILQDLQGPKIRLGEFAEGAKHELAVGDFFVIDDEKAQGDKNRCQLPHPEILDILSRPFVTSSEFLNITDKLHLAIAHRGSPKVLKQEKQKLVVTALGGLCCNLGDDYDSSIMLQSISEGHIFHDTELVHYGSTPYKIIDDSCPGTVVFSVGESDIDGEFCDALCEYKQIPPFALRISWEGSIDSFRFSVFEEDCVLCSFGYDYENNLAFICCGEYRDHNRGGAPSLETIQSKDVLTVGFDTVKKIICFNRYLVSYRNRKVGWYSFNACKDSRCAVVCRPCVSFDGDCYQMFGDHCFN